MRSPEFHRDVADAIIRVWRQRQQFYGYDVGPARGEPARPPRRFTADEPGILEWAPSSDGPQPSLSTVAEMTSAIGRAYDALRPLPFSTPTGAPTAEAAASPRTSRIALWVVAVGDLGGVARHVLDTTRTGIPGWRIVVLCPEGRLAERLRAQGSAVLTGPISPSDSLRGGLAAVRHTVRTLRPTVVHSHLAYSDFLVAGAATGSPPGMTAKRVTTEHGIAGIDVVYHGTAWRSRVMALAHAVRLRRFDALIAVADATLVAVQCKWHPPRGLRTVVVPNGVDPVADVPAPPPGRFHVVSLSRLAPEKRLGDLVEAFALVRAEYPEARLTLAGEGPLQLTLRQQVSDLGLGDAVSLLGYADADTLLRSTDVLAQLSVWENCSYTLLDAYARGIPVVATSTGGNPEVAALRRPQQIRRARE